jgi:saccharopine dehydrogenase-like NADP-dependent oxidoreductase
MGAFRVIVVGAGRVGIEVAELLHAVDDFSVSVFDIANDAYDRAAARDLHLLHNDVIYHSGLARLFSELKADAVVAALPASHCDAIASAARKAGAHYVDLVEEVSPAIGAIAEGASTSFVRGCGIAPGLITQLVLNALAECPWARHCEVSTGILSKNASNRMAYELTWDVGGLIDEYCLPGITIRNGRIEAADARSCYKSFDIAGVAHEAFVTGGLGSRLAEHLTGKLESLTFLTIRRKGHLDYINFLLEDMGLLNKKYMLDSLLRNGIPEAKEDEALILLHLSGGLDTRQNEKRLYRVSTETSENGTIRMAGRRLAASHVAAVVDMLRAGDIDENGIVTQESISAPALLSNRFLSWLPSTMTRQQAVGPDM